MKTLRRAAFALAMAGLATAALKLKGSGEVPPQGGGWRELTGPDLR
ncbi:MAG: hypothetical protein ABR511_07875 [Acidimicrobiales bacterium]